MYRSSSMGCAKAAAIAVCLAACSPAQTLPAAGEFTLIDPNKYKTDVEKARAWELAQTVCKAKALTAAAELEKTIAAERHSMANVDRAREKGAEMYTTAYTLCLLSSGYAKK
ncbi:MAG: hypothetical protein ACLPPF_19010 [Rhodomicrobium sp.]